MQVWKTFGSTVVVEKVAGTELQSLLVCSVLGMKVIADTYNAYRYKAMHRWKAPMEN